MIKKRLNVTGAHFILEEDRRYYPIVRGDNGPYNLIFVDGRLREKCLAHTKTIMTDDAFIVLHDAERLDYAKSIASFDYQVFTDNSNTVTLTNDRTNFTKLIQLLSTRSI